MSLKKLTTHYARILRLWPHDALRPITFQAATRRRIQHMLLPADARIYASSTSLHPVTPRAIDDEKAELEQLNALYSLLENRYRNAYPTSDALLNPAFKPSHYADLMEEMEAAPKRSWLAQKWLRWSRFVRFS